MNRLGITMPILNQPIGKFPEYARLAEEAGFDSVWDYEFYRNPFVIHGTCAQVTKRIQLATGLAAGAARSPFEMANSAADIDELSGGRMLLGLGTGAPGWADAFNGVEVDKAVSRISEYLDVVRLAWDYMSTGKPAEYQGRFYRFNSPPMNIFGLRPIVRPRIPVYLAALGPKMLQLTGEKAEGLLGWMYTPEMITQNVLPNLAIGAKKAGRNLADIDTAAEVLCSVSDDRKEALRRARISVGIYVAYPSAEPLVNNLGLQDDRNALLQALMTKGQSAFESTTSDALLHAFSIAGTPAECHEQYQAYRKVLTHVILHTPYVPPISTADSEDAFRNNVRAFAR